MRQRWRLMAYYFFFWLMFFLVGRVVFLAFHIHITQNLTLKNIFMIFWVGIRQDLSLAGYVSVIPFLLTSFSNFIKKSKLERYIFSYTFTLALVFNLLMIIDLQVFNVWNTRLDLTPFQYLTSIRQAFGSVKAAPSLPLWISFLVFLLVSIFFVYRKITRFIDDWKHVENFPYFLPLSLAITCILIIPIRGGIQTAPIEQKDAFFSQSNFSNLASINPIWNLFNSVLDRPATKPNPYLYLPNYTIDRVRNFLFAQNTTSTGQLKNHQNFIFTFSDSEGISDSTAYQYFSGEGLENAISEFLTGTYRAPNKPLFDDPERHDLTFISTKYKEAGYKCLLVSDKTFSVEFTKFLGKAGIEFISPSNFKPSQEKLFCIFVNAKFDLSQKENFVVDFTLNPGTDSIIESHKVYWQSKNAESWSAKPSSLADWPATLSSGMGWANTFKWSKDLQQKNQKKWAYFVGSRGFGMAQNQNVYYYDIIKDNLVELDTAATQPEINRGKAILQRTYQEYLDSKK